MLTQAAAPERDIRLHRARDGDGTGKHDARAGGRIGVRRASARGARGGPNILLVEDNPVNREVAVGHAREPGCATDTAENGWMALKSMNAATYDAVLMDCQNGP